MSLPVAVAVELTNNDSREVEINANSYDTPPKTKKSHSYSSFWPFFACF